MWFALAVSESPLATPHDPQVFGTSGSIVLAVSNTRPTVDVHFYDDGTHLNTSPSDFVISVIFEVVCFIFNAHFRANEYRR